MGKLGCGLERSSRGGTAFALALGVAIATACGSEGAADGAGVAADAAVTDGDASGDTTSAETSSGDAGATDAAADAAADTGDGKDAAAVDTGLTAPPWTPDRPCNTGGGELPVGVQELAWDDGKAQSHVEAQPQWNVVGHSVMATPLYEAVRFDIDRPTKIWGVKVQYGLVAAAADAAVKVGLYRDFGHNGFDFWAPDPIWEVARCGDQVSTETWVTLRFPQPFLVDQPGLVYVAHLRDGKGAPAWAFDGSLPTGCTDAAKCCETFAACHSAWNFPTVKSWTSDGQQTKVWQGLSTSRPVDYLVRLLVEPVEQPDATLDRFEPVAGAPKLGHRMAVGDFDGDGFEDVFDSSSKLYRNDQGKLVDVTEATGIAALGLGANGGVWGDYDRDGDLDLLAFWETPAGGDRLLRNDGGTFVDVTEKAGLSDLQSYNPCPDGKGESTIHEPTPAAAWIDLDGDGLLDLYLSNFICWQNYSYYVDRVWHNKGDGLFEEWTGTKGFWGPANPKMPSRGALPADFDGDGDVDLFVHTYVLFRDLLWRNKGAGAVEEVGEKLGVAGVGTVNGGIKRYGHGIGSVWGDLNGDGRLDLVVGNLAHPRFWDFSNKSEVFLQQEDGTFVDVQSDWSLPLGVAGLTYQETHSVPALLDADHDGDLDLIMTATYDGRPTELYLGEGDGSFALARWRSGIDERNSWGVVSVDLDHDGDLDVLTPQGVYRNRGVEHAGRHWLQVGLRGGKGRDVGGVGATIRVHAGGKVFLRVVDGGSGQGCQSSGVVHVGLGALAAVDKVEVVWPGGAKTTVDKGLAADQRVWIAADGVVTPGWGPP